MTKYAVLGGSRDLQSFSVINGTGLSQLESDMINKDPKMGVISYLKKTNKKNPSSTQYNSIS